MDYKDYYSVLGVSKEAEAGDIQKAFRKLARKYHPDVNSTPEAEAKFKEINEAHEVLKDPEKRAKYDQFGSAWKQTQNTGAPPPGYEDIFTVFTSGGGERQQGYGGFGGEGFSSFFDMLFGSGFSGGNPQAGWSTGGPGEVHAQGADHEASISLGLVEASQGGEREISLTDPMTGQRRTLRVKIPKGVRPGQRIRLSSQGGLGSDGKTRGDLYLKVDLLPDPRFRLEGSDLYSTLSISPSEAALGGQARVPTLDGSVTVKIPAGSSSGRKIRLRGKGFPSAKGEAGDLFAEVRIQVPEQLSAKEKELYEELARISNTES